MPLKRFSLWIIIGAAVLAAGSCQRPALVGPATTPRAPTRWVTDNAQFLSPDVRDAVDSRLREYQARTGHQVVVWIGSSTRGEPIEAFAKRAANAWGVGRKGINDGLAIFIFATDRTIRIEVGRGFEAQVTNAIASRIIQEVMAPRLRAGDRNGAVIQGVNATLRVIDGAPWSTVAKESGALAPPPRR